MVSIKTFKKHMNAFHGAAEEMVTHSRLSPLIRAIVWTLVYTAVFSLSWNHVYWFSSMKAGQDASLALGLVSLPPALACVLGLAAWGAIREERRLFAQMLPHELSCPVLKEVIKATIRKSLWLNTEGTLFCVFLVAPLIALVVAPLQSIEAVMFIMGMALWMGVVVGIGLALLRQVGALYKTRKDNAYQAKLEKLPKLEVDRMRAKAQALGIPDNDPMLLDETLKEHAQRVAAAKRQASQLDAQTAAPVVGRKKSASRRL